MRDVGRSNPLDGQLAFSLQDVTQSGRVTYSLRWIVRIANQRNEMSKLRKVLTIASITALGTFGIAGCGGDEPNGTTDVSGGGDINMTMTAPITSIRSSPTRSRGGRLRGTSTPLCSPTSTRRATAGTEVVPGLAEAMPEVSADGRTYKLKLRPNMKYSDGTPIKASDFTYAIQRLFKADSGGSVFYDGIVGATDYAEGRPTRSAASRPTTTPVTSPSSWRPRTGPSTTCWG